MTRLLNGAPEDTRKAADAIDPVGQKLVAVFDRTRNAGQRQRSEGAAGAFRLGAAAADRRVRPGQRNP
jgi:hypothetical protein